MLENHDDDKTQSFTPLTKDTEVGHYKIIEERKKIKQQTLKLRKQNYKKAIARAQMMS